MNQFLQAFTNMFRIPDLRKLDGMIGFHPDTPIEGIVDRVLAWERANA